ncbi:MFS transporter [Trichococcus patagoniensis]|uniref:MFS transporter n=1 Tax=Trichococcus patagoniensis TaxID=382641 RepID=A0A2T5IJ00_9LACT|nr:MFS transporter [Trichococcus patagoniensis]
MTADNPTEIFTAGGWKSMAIIGLFISIKIFTGFPNSQVLTMAADVSDYETAKSGRYVSGLIGTIFSFIDSLSSSLTPIIVGWIAITIGYNNAYPAATDTFNSELFKGTLIGFVLIPVAVLACVLGMMRFYSLDKETMETIQKAINERKNTNGTVAEPAEAVEIVAAD